MENRWHRGLEDSKLSPVSYCLGQHYRVEDFSSDSLGLRAKFCTGLDLRRALKVLCCWQGESNCHHSWWFWKVNPDFFFHLKQLTENSVELSQFSLIIIHCLLEHSLLSICSGRWASSSLDCSTVRNGLVGEGLFFPVTNEPQSVPVLWTVESVYLAKQ